jgi:hypothetical protein
MKVYLFLLAGIIQQALAQPQASHHGPEQVTLLRIEASAFGEEQEFQVTADSLIVDKRTGSEHAHHTQAITAEERSNLLEPFNKVYLSSLKSSYEGYGAPDDAMAFELFIHKGRKVKSVRVYMYKLLPMYLFSNRLNLLLPPKYRMAYNKQYFTY